MANKIPVALFLSFGNRINEKIEKDNCQCVECRALGGIVNCQTAWWSNEKGKTFILNYFIICSIINNEKD